MSRLKHTLLLTSMLTLAACDGVQVGPGTAPEDNLDQVSTDGTSNNTGAIIPDSSQGTSDAGSSGDNASAPQNSLTFASGEQSLSPRTRLDKNAIASTGSTFDKIQSEIITPKCAGCHIGGDKTLPGSMNFSSANDSYASLVGAISTEYPQLNLVQAGVSSKSYMVRKIEGTQLVGKQMPLQGGPLTNEEIKLIKDWIDTGAER